jgi:ADP-ribosylation factor-like protein 5B
MTIVKNELMNMLNNEDLKNIKLLIYANKQDLKESMTSSEISDSLNLHKVKTHEWHLQGCCALSGSGLLEGLGFGE